MKDKTIPKQVANAESIARILATDPSIDPGAAEQLATAIDRTIKDYFKKKKREIKKQADPFKSAGFNKTGVL
jgi:hypothetical protein